MKTGRKIKRVGEFEKVSFDKFYAAIKEKFGVGEQYAKETYDKILLPSRATAGSAGYDFYAPFDITLCPKGTVEIPTGICVKIDEGWWLGCLPRSGLGFKYRVQLDNTMGVIDSDYYYSDNGGQIFAKITNDSMEDKTVDIAASDRFMQAIFIPYGITYSDNTQNKRNGGFGSTGK